MTPRMNVVCLTGIVAAVPALAQADFLKDSRLNFSTKNYYFNRDYRDGTGPSKAEEWAQGFVMKYQSGYTDGPLGFGLDAIGMLGIKLDSAPERSGTGILARQAVSDHPGKPYAKRAADDYSKLGLTAKARLFDSNELFVGSLQPAGIAVIQPNISRLFPQTFEGQQLTSKAIENLTLNLGHISQVKQRDSTDFEKMGITSQSGQYSSAARSDDFKFAAADYQITRDLLASLHFGRLQDIYQQGFVGLKYNTPLGPGRLLGELRYFDGSDAGAALGGHVDNQALSTNFGYSIDGHTVSGGYQKQWGDTAYPLIDGTVSYLFTELQVSNFSRARERSWRARYDYNFAAAGMPGLTFTTVYVQGDQARVVNMNQEGQEWERDTYITYVVQDGPLKNVGVQWLNATQRSNYTRNTDENRLIFSYSLALK